MTKWMNEWTNEQMNACLPACLLPAAISANHPCVVSYHLRGKKGCGGGERKGEKKLKEPLANIPTEIRHIIISNPVWAIKKKNRTRLNQWPKLAFSGFFRFFRQKSGKCHHNMMTHAFFRCSFFFRPKLANREGKVGGTTKGGLGDDEYGWGRWKGG